MTTDGERIAHILGAIARIEEIAGRGREAFDESHILQAAALYNVQLIGEAASQLTQEARDRYPDAPWRNVISMRHFVMHRYFDVDLEVVWETVAVHAPLLRRQLGGG